jgi:hypothetical protein
MTEHAEHSRNLTDQKKFKKTLGSPAKVESPGLKKNEKPQE